MAVSAQHRVFDEVDYKIIRALHEDARLSASKIAKAVGINERTAHRRIDALIESGAVRISAVCEPSAFGYNSTLTVYLLVHSTTRDEIVSQLLKHASICYLSTGLGDQEIIVQGRFKSGEELDRFLNGFIKQLPGVEIKNYFLETSLLRSIDTWLPAAEDFAKNSRITLKSD